MKQFLWMMVILSVVSGYSVASETKRAGASEFYIAPNGSDTNPGTEQQPFASLAHARDVVRQFKKANPEKEITILLRGGVYPLTETVVFTPDDSGGPKQTITYKAYPGEKPILSGGVPVKHWEKLKDGPGHLPDIAKGKVWVADVSYIREIKKQQIPSPTVATQMDRTNRFLTLYDGAVSLQRARGKGFSLAKVSAENESYSTFVFPASALQSWPDIANAELAVITRRSWMTSILPIKQIDEAAATGQTTVPCTYVFQSRGKTDKPFTHIENVLAVLDEPGEWVLDSRNDKLYLWPAGNGRPGKDSVIPVLTELVRIEGRIDYDGSEDTPVKNLVFSGLTFSHGDRFPWHGKTGWGVQHDWERFDSPSAMMRFRGSENCAVKNCRFTAAGSSGLRFDLHSQNNRIIANHFDQLGGVGILLAGYGPGAKDVNKNNEISNNLIHNIGQLYCGSPGIFIWQSGENKIANNELYNLPYAGICVTGRIVWDKKGDEECSKTIRWKDVEQDKELWTYGKRKNSWHEREKYLHARNNTVSRNDIHDIMQICGDGNCVYISGAGTGNKVLENYCHDCPSSHMNNAIRCDDDQNGTVISRNIIHRTGGYAEGLMTKGNNEMTENLMVDLRTGNRHRGYIRFYAGNVKGAVIQRNVLYSRDKTQSPTHDGVVKNGRPAPKFSDTDADYNLYFCTEDPDWGKRHIQKCQKQGIEQHSVSADPLFVDIDKGDFRFKPGSPALKLGVAQPVSIKNVGLQPPHRQLLKKAVPTRTHRPRANQPTPVISKGPAFLQGDHTIPPAGWVTDEVQAMARAKRENKPVVMFFSITGCTPCAWVKNTVFNLDQSKEILKDIVCIYVFDRRDLDKKYEIKMYPTFVFLDPQGKEFDRFPGFDRHAYTIESWKLLIDRAMNKYKP